MPPRLATKRQLQPPPRDAELQEMIAQAAYYRAEKRGFQPGLESEDWVQAEAEVMARLQALRGRP